ncbi:MAG: DUF6798 domain-containing protein [Pirellulaceae bacterium]
METALIVVLVFLYAGTPPPDVNEAHYLTKAKHYWNPTWCATDVFLTSADAHRTFCAVFGWPSLWVSLPVVAWMGRFVVWSLMALGWQRLSWSILPRRHVSLLSAAWFLMLSDYCHLAGEWAVGGLEAKGIAYACVLGALHAMVSRRWSAAWIWLGAASAFHVLVGGWSAVAAAIAWWLSPRERLPLRQMWPGLAAGFALALLGLVPALTLTSGADPEITSKAHQIYVFGRLSHHLLFLSFGVERWAMFGLLVGAWVGLWWMARRSERWRILHRFALGAVMIALAGMVVDRLTCSCPPLAAHWLRFYWYRLADVAVPLCVALAVPWTLNRWEAQRLPTVRILWGIAVLLPMWALGILFVEHHLDFRPGAIVQSSPPRRMNPRQLTARYRAWQDVCAWIASHTKPEDRFLTPRNQQTFKWYAGRAEVVCWKDLPQDPVSINQWWLMLQDIYPSSVIEGGLAAWSDEQLLAIAEEQQVSYIVLDRAQGTRRLGFERVYPESPAATGWFEVYRVGPAP